ncbi:MAG: RDD family protein [Microthrixaceae bacterium]
MATLARGIVTPEAVVLDFDTAGIASRALARAIDTMIQGVLMLVVVIVALNVIGGEGWLALLLVISGAALVVIGYPIVAELAMRGRSPGKAALGLRVVTVEGAPISARHAFVRSAIGIVDFLIVPGGLVAVVVALLSPRSQRLGDVFAGTMVLRERSAARPAVAVWFNAPAGLEGYAATLDVSAVTDAQFAIVRAYLLRLAGLSPEARASLSVRLATPLVAAMHHHTPPGVHADHFLQCVAAAYQRRHAGSTWNAPPPPPPPPPPPQRPRRAAPLAAAPRAPSGTSGSDFEAPG